MSQAQHVAQMLQKPGEVCWSPKSCKCSRCPQSSKTGPETCQSIADHRDSRHCCSLPHSHWTTTGWVVSLLLLVARTQLVRYAVWLLGSALGVRGLGLQRETHRLLGLQRETHRLLGLQRETHRLLGLVMQGKVHMLREMAMLGRILKGHSPLLLRVHIPVQKLGPLQMHSLSEITIAREQGDLELYTAFYAPSQKVQIK